MRTVCHILLLAMAFPFAALASDEIQGSVAEILSAIKNRSIGKAYAVNARIATPPVGDDSRFIVSDSTGSVVIRCDLDRPAETFRAGDIVMLRCEIGATASTPAAAYFRSMSLTSRGLPSDGERSNWLVSMQDNESARVVKLPHCLTVLNVTIIAGGVLLLFLMVLAWNTLLRRLVDRRSLELTNERLASFSADLKVEERTRLAVELHDTIAQMLTGVSLEIDTARDLVGSDTAEADRHLALATRTLSSCRNDLRNCMWDLGNQTLDDIRMDGAIRRTLAPHLAGAKLSVRFDVKREILSDNTALSILRMIRELTLNAIRHGHATAIKVAGCIDSGQLLFSVIDNGCGFDPETAPGVDKGHFGLQGVLERAERLDGEMTVESAPGKGTRVSCRILASPASSL